MHEIHAHGFAFTRRRCGAGARGAGLLRILNHNRSLLTYLIPGPERAIEQPPTGLMANYFQGRKGSLKTTSAPPTQRLSSFDRDPLPSRIEFAPSHLQDASKQRILVWARPGLLRLDTPGPLIGPCLASSYFPARWRRSTVDLVAVPQF